MTCALIAILSSRVNKGLLTLLGESSGLINVTAEVNFINITEFYTGLLVKIAEMHYHLLVVVKPEKWMSRTLCL